MNAWTIAILAAAILPLRNVSGTTGDSPPPPYLTLTSGYETLGESSFYIPEGYLVEIKSLELIDGSRTPSHKKSYVHIEGTAEEYPFSLTLHSEEIPQTLSTFLGPIMIQLWADAASYSKAFAVLKITEPKYNEVIPKNTVVIPADAAGPVEIILECSEDLITWTPADAGTYGRGENKRFFRVRSLVHSD
ncbi:MAG: hypothetical protein GWO81_06120 [Verrucomicrobia bacterium]|nr:hypothetical protein [Verrucomicrobiota bacterium]